MRWVLIAIALLTTLLVAQNGIARTRVGVWPETALGGPLPLEAGQGMTEAGEPSRPIEPSSRISLMMLLAGIAGLLVGGDRRMTCRALEPGRSVQ
jgi:hypothetical protein